MTAKWFAAKTVYRTTAVGRPLKRTPEYRADATLVEERIVLIRAKDFKGALKKAEAEAKRFARTTHKNPFGQVVKTRFLGDVDLWLIHDELEEGCEIFGSTEVLSSKVSDRAILDAKFGAAPDKDWSEARVKFRNAALVGEDD